MAAFIIRWIMEEGATEERAASLLTEILLQISTKIPMQIDR